MASTCLRRDIAKGNLGAKHIKYNKVTNVSVTKASDLKSTSV